MVYVALKFDWLVVSGQSGFSYFEFKIKLIRLVLSFK